MALSGSIHGHRNPQFHSTFLDTVGDGTGSISMNVDGSVTPVDFKLICPEGKKLIGFSFHVLVEDGGVWGANKYGGLAAMVNGITGYIKKADETVIPWFAQRPVKEISDWIAYCHNYQHIELGIGDQTMTFTYDFRAEGPGLTLYPGDEGGLTISDDLTDLTDHVCRFGVTSYDYHEFSV